MGQRELEVGKRGSWEGGGQRADNRGQKTEDRRQKTEDRGQRAEDRIKVSAIGLRA